MRPHKKTHAKRRQHGVVKYYPETDEFLPGHPLTFEPIDGVRRRIRTLGDCERWFESGNMSDEDFQKCQEAFERNSN